MPAVPVMEEWPSSSRPGRGKSAAIHVLCSGTNLDVHARREVQQAQKDVSKDAGGSAGVYHLVDSQWLLDSISNFAVMDHADTAYEVRYS